MIPNHLDGFVNQIESLLESMMAGKILESKTKIYYSWNFSIYYKSCDMYKNPYLVNRNHLNQFRNLESSHHNFNSYQWKLMVLDPSNNMNHGSGS